MSFKIEKLEDLLKGHINGPILEQKISRLTAPGENFGSLMLKVDIKVKNGEKEEILQTVAKCVPPNKEMQKIFNTETTFKNEIGWYTTVIPTVIEFQKEQCVKNVAEFFMKIYGARLSLDPNNNSVDDDGIILCENLAVRGYKNADRREGFNLEQSKEIIKKLATFHALTLGLRLKKREIFDQKVKKYLYNEKFPTVKERKSAFKSVIELLKEQKETSLLVPRAEKILNYENDYSSDLREPWISAIHTDFWVNNIMLKEKQGEAPKVIILDLQMCGYGSPVDDLLFFLGTSLGPSLAEKHMDELIKLYYIELMENLKFLNVDTTLFPYGSYLKELELEGPRQFSHCMFFVAIIMAEKGKGADPTSKEFNPQDELIKMFSSVTEKHKEKYVFLTKEFAKRNWI